MRTIAALIAAILVVPQSSAAVTNRARYLMGTVCEIAADAPPERIDDAFAEAKRVESMLSTWTDASELARLNRAGAATISPELASLLRTACDWSAKTGGTFNPLVGPLVDAWKTREAGAIPSRVAIAGAIARMQIANVAFDRDRVTLKNGAEFEEGGFGKGYALDRMLALLPNDALINFGGQLALRGTMQVSIADPRDREHAVLAFTMSDGSLSTSSGSEKTFEIGGRRFSHLLDPRTGEALPPRGSVSVVADQALEADILSTALYVMGEEDALRWADANGVCAVTIDVSNHIRLSTPCRERVRDLQVLDPHFQTVKD